MKKKKKTKEKGKIKWKLDKFKKNQKPRMFERDENRKRKVNIRKESKQFWKGISKAKMKGKEKKKKR